MARRKGRHKQPPLKDQLMRALRISGTAVQLAARVDRPYNIVVKNLKELVQEGRAKKTDRTPAVYSKAKRF